MTPRAGLSKQNLQADDHLLSQGSISAPTPYQKAIIEDSQGLQHITDWGQDRATAAVALMVDAWTLEHPG